MKRVTLVQHVMVTESNFTLHVNEAIKQILRDSEIPAKFPKIIDIKYSSTANSENVYYSALIIYEVNVFSENSHEQKDSPI